MLKFYNTLTRKKEVFKPIKDKEVKMYTCGPTVYDFAHIGNFRAYIFEDLLRRYLKYKGYKVKQVMNITDVDDKTIKGSKKENISLKEFTRKYEKAFFEDIKKLNIEKVEVYPRATEHIKEMQNIINILLKKNVAYKSKDGIYFSISKFKDYGKLANIKNLKIGASGRVKVDEYEKEQAQDFALWKFWDKEDGNVKWKASFGDGRPGWHIECSAMSMKYLGENFDVHTGGIDNIFPHHQNEIAQSEACTGKKFVNYWLHCEHLLVDGRKMSKSLSNFYTLRDLLNKGYDSISIKYLLLATHYRQNLNFTLEALEGAKNSVERLRDFMHSVKDLKYDSKTDKLVDNVKREFENALDDDLNISEALASIFNFIRDINKLGIGGEKIYNLMLDFDKVLGLNLYVKKEILSKEIKELIKKREKYRKEKNFKKADEFREKLKEKGIILEDTNKGVKVKKIA